MIKLIECPRDAWQGLPTTIPPEIKADYLRLLIAAGFTAIDAVSFVSKAAVPQMADSEQVLTYLAAAEAIPATVEIIAIVPNLKGAERAIATRAVATIGFPYSISPAFLQRNQNQTPEESLEALEAIGTVAYKAGLEVVAYVSMAFGNPYSDAWSIDEVVAACDLLADSGVTQISLADTVGLATPRLLSETLADVLAVHGDTLEIGVHLHTTPESAPALIEAAYTAGCRRFDSALGGLGGCPFAQSTLVGNLPTETLLAELTRLGAELPALQPLDSLLAATREIARKYGPRPQ